MVHSRLASPTRTIRRTRTLTSFECIRVPPFTSAPRLLGAAQRASSNFPSSQCRSATRAWHTGVLVSGRFRTPSSIPFHRSMGCGAYLKVPTRHPRVLCLGEDLTPRTYAALGGEDATTFGSKEARPAPEQRGHMTDHHALCAAGL